jgi:hypothetical protein
MDDDAQTMPSDDLTASGIVQCLRMLAEEAAALRLARTLAALQTAIDVCAAETDHGGVTIAPPPGTLLH